MSEASIPEVGSAPVALARPMPDVIEVCLYCFTSLSLALFVCVACWLITREH